METTYRKLYQGWPLLWAALLALLVVMANPEVSLPRDMRLDGMAASRRGF